MFSSSQPPRLCGKDWLLPMEATQTRCKSMIYTESKHTETGRRYLRGFLEQIQSYMDGD